MIKAIIFDLDGVIADTERTKFDLLKILLKQRGIILAEADYKKSVGIKIVIFLKKYFGNELTDAEINNIFFERKEELHRNPAKYVIEQPYAVDCCKKLFEAGFILAIASASDEKDVKLVLSQLNILQFFKTIISSDSVENYKPHPETYLKCVEKLQLPTQECIAIEDSPTGVKSAIAAGLACVAVTYTHSKDELNEANEIIDSLDQLTPEFAREIKD
ncbi:MAG: HAD family phosphatase [Patescibacteria group bacterium]|jgi:beta-phosphoglucomutase-like phosphatase (HAD superfamily)